MCEPQNYNFGPRAGFLRQTCAKQTISEEKKKLDDDLQMSLRSLVFIGFHVGPFYVEANLSNYTCV